MADIALTGMPSKLAPRAVGVWLLCVAALVFLMVIVGGATRLTESGLSIVEWKPVTGALPPLSASDWQNEFEAYQQSPEYKLVNRGMSLAEFKTIFWWEWGHRLLGRLIGFAFLLPFLWFLARKSIPTGFGPRLAGLFVLGGLQGALGWWMVASGLVSEPAVSHYRLAAHLGLALAIFSALLWTALDLLLVRKASAPVVLTRLSWGFLGLLAVQIVFGAFVAGLDAGLAYNTWPLMDGRFIPDGVFQAKDILHDTLSVQFTHRMLAYALVLYGVYLILKLWRAGVERALALSLGLALGGQFLLGVLTLLAHVPVALGTAHQGGAVVVLALSLILAHRLAGRGKAYEH